MENLVRQARQEPLQESTHKRKMSETVQNHPWQWQLTGNETAEEKRILADMLKEAKAFCNDFIFGKAPRWLTIIGKSGCGKTWLARQIRDFLKKHSWDVYYRTRRQGQDGYSGAQDGPIFDRWGKMVSGLRSDDGRAYNRGIGDWLKIIDDLGVDSFGSDGEVTLFARQKIGHLLDMRLRKWTVITSNYSVAMFQDHFDARIADRMQRDGNRVFDCGKLRSFTERANDRDQGSAPSTNSAEERKLPNEN
jgi:DNA replication protein DnaC